MYNITRLNLSQFKQYESYHSRTLTACMHSLFLYLISFFICLDVSEPSSMSGPSFPSSSSHHDLTTYLFLQFTHDGMPSNPKTPYTKMMHPYPRIEPQYRWQAGKEGTINMDCVVLGDREGEWSNILCRAHLRLGLGTPEYNPHCLKKLCRGHWEIGLCSWIISSSCKVGPWEVGLRIFLREGRTG